MNVADVRDGKRHDMWIPLASIKMGRLHLAITVLESVRQVLFEFLCPVCGNFLLLIKRKLWSDVKILPVI